jgi:holliday junction resolvase YEN1
LETKQIKALIRAFGFVEWDAPGEAEAECALLQSRGIVDLVITEDVDCLMFGATKVAREIPDKKKRSHVFLYSNVEFVTGLDRDGLVLVAMMSGGDYLPAGVPKCGPKTAAEVCLSNAFLIVDCAGGV